MKVVVRCVYCEGVAVYRDTYDKAVCPCGETRIAKHRDNMTGYDVINVWADIPESNGYSKNAPPAQLPAEEATARLNVAGLVDRITALERSIDLLFQAGDHTAGRVTVLEDLQSGKVIAQRLGEYMRTVSVRE